MERPKYIDMYKDFLSIVRKSRIGTVIPEEFARVLNQAMEEIITNKLSTMEISKKIYDDLSPLRKNVKNQIMTLDQADNFTAVSAIINTTVGYRRIASVSVNLSSTIKNVKCHFITSNEKTEILTGYYSKPSKFKCYYAPYVSGPSQKLKIYVPSTMTIGVTSNYDIYVDPALVTQQNVITESKSIFGKEICNEFVNAAARMYIERVQDARFQTFNHDLNNKINN